VDKALTWFMRLWGAVLAIWCERRHLRLQLDHDKAITAALQELNEAATQLKTLALKPGGLSRPSGTRPNY
jgi:hypothetical protein